MFGLRESSLPLLPRRGEEETMSKRRPNWADQVRRPVAKKPWNTPHLIEYGHVAELTAGTTGSHTDKGHLANEHGQG
jgi:hypothetical protein